MHSVKSKPMEHAKMCHRAKGQKKDTRKEDLTFYRASVSDPFQTPNEIQKEVSKKVCIVVLIPYAEENMPLRWCFMHDNGLKHTSRIV